ncbi:MAG: c-type cytochrome [Gaiellaceae bacterium]
MIFALSTESEVALAVMGGIFIAFSLVSSFVLPRRNPDFPGKRWRNVYIVVCAALFIAMMSTVLVFGKEDEEARAEEVAAENPTETTSTGTVPGETTPTSSEEGGRYGNGNPAAGKIVFTSKGCGACHTMEAAGATGSVGPNLDEVKPDEALIADRVVHGKGTMPAFGTQLTDEQIADVVAYVHESTQSG